LPFNIGYGNIVQVNVSKGFKGYNKKDNKNSKKIQEL
jgi:hypothetical protein